MLWAAATKVNASRRSIFLISGIFVHPVELVSRDFRPPRSTFSYVSPPSPACLQSRASPTALPPPLLPTASPLSLCPASFSFVSSRLLHPHDSSHSKSPAFTT